MNYRVPVILPLIPLILGSSILQADETQAEASQPALPPGMARANNPQQVAHLYSEERQREVEAMRKEAKARAAEQAGKDGLTDQEAYTQRLIAYRTRLVEEQRELQRQQKQLEMEREARLRAEALAEQRQRERQRESIFIQHHTVHAYQRRLNDEYVREQRLLRALAKQHCQNPPPCSTPAAPAEESCDAAMP